MDCFEILGISKTGDVKEIRRAYSRLLTKYSPEKDQEGFQRLRAAYEEAVSKANEQEEKREVLLPEDEFMREFEAVYGDFEKRLNLHEWKELLERDVCYNIDTSVKISRRILNFIMNNYNFPTEIWRLFNDYFFWTAKKEALYNEFPSNFVDFVIYKINVESQFDYEYLKECLENRQDEFIAEFRKADDAIQNFDLYGADRAIRNAENICKDHPDLLILKGRYFTISGQIEEAERLFTGIINYKKGDLNAFYFRGELYFRIGKLKEAHEDYKRALEIDPSSQGVWHSLGKCCICLKRYEEAVEHLQKSYEKHPYSRDIGILLNSANNFYIESLSSQIEEDPTANNLKFKLAEAYFRISRTEESYNILNEVMEKSEFTPEIYSLYCQILVVKKKSELAYLTISKALDLFKDNYKLNFLKAHILEELGKNEEAILQYDKVIQLNNQDLTPYNNKAFILNKLKRHNEALESANIAINIDSEYAHGYKNKAAALLGLELYEDCLNACERALSIYPYITDAYIIKMKAFIAMNMLDEALGAFKRASDFGLKDSMLYYERARALEILGKYDEALKFCDLALELDSKSADVYYLKGLCCFNTKDYNSAIELFDLSIKHDPSYSSAYYYKAESLIKTSRGEEATGIIDEALALKLEGPGRFYSLKGTVLSNFKRYEEAICEYKNAINHEPYKSSYYYSIGHAFNELKKYNDAIEYYNRYVELEPNSKEGYANISYSLFCLGRYEECIEYCERVISIDPKYVLGYRNKGWALYRLKRLEEAEAECEKAIKKCGVNKNLLLLKLEIFQSKEMYQEAVIVCDRILELDENAEDIKKLRNEYFDKIYGTKEKNKMGKLFKSLFK